MEVVQLLLVGTATGVWLCLSSKSHSMTIMLQQYSFTKGSLCSLQQNVHQWCRACRQSNCNNSNLNMTAFLSGSGLGDQMGCVLACCTIGSRFKSHCIKFFNFSPTFQAYSYGIWWNCSRGRHIDYLDGHHSIQTNQCPPAPSPHFLQAGCPSCCPTNSDKALRATSTFGLGRRC